MSVPPLSEYASSTATIEPRPPAVTQPSGATGSRRAPHARERVNVLGVQITNITKTAATCRMQELIRGSDGHARAVYIVNAHTLNLASETPGYREVLNAADIVFGDGAGVRWAARIQGIRMVDNLVGTDLIPFFFTNTVDQGYRYFLLGAEAPVVARAADHVRTQFPGISIVGFHHGHLAREERAAVIDEINAAQPDVVLVAMGNPTQEHWIHEHRSHVQAGICIGVGGLFDHWGGVLKRAPRWVRRNGLEWAQLLMQQPHKWRRYVIGNPKFILRVVRRDVTLESRDS